ncbi:MAG: hypothetical protein ABIF85_00770 [Nanoarchaeota archaeon]
MNFEKAYLLGFILGGGKIINNKLIITLPYNSWGSAFRNPVIAGKISQDIVNYLNPVFRNEYGVQIAYNAAPEWRITVNEIPEDLKRDLRNAGFETSGELRTNSKINGVLTWTNENWKKHFIAGLADSIGSVAPSHRRFSSEYQIVSFEFKGQNYTLVYQICNLLRGLNCHADQILWNHPNQHVGENPYYKQWNKGFKLRILLDHYVSQNSFLFRAKKAQTQTNIDLQSRSTSPPVKCPDRRLIIDECKVVHPAENSGELPENIRGLHFIHSKHICAVMGCKYAPYDLLKEKLKEIEKYISSFPIIVKGTKSELEKLIRSDDLMAKRRYKTTRMKLKDVYRLYAEDNKALLFGNSKNAGYPVKYVLQGVNYIMAAKKGEVKGKRALGNFETRIISGIEKKEVILLKVPDKMTPLILVDSEYSAIIGPVNPDVYKKLVTRIDDLRVHIREIRESDLT